MTTTKETRKPDNKKKYIKESHPLTKSENNFEVFSSITRKPAFENFFIPL